MLSDTLATGLAEYRIGPKVRALRLEKKLGLVQLGEHTGLSSALLSKIERGQLFPTLPTLLRIALVFGVGLEHFFTAEERPAVAVTRRKDRLRLPNRNGKAAPSYIFESLDYPATNGKMHAYLAEFSLGAKSSEPHRHEGTEFVYVLRGELAINVEGEDTCLGEGDTVVFDSSAAHSYRRQGRSICQAIVVVVD